MFLDVAALDWARGTIVAIGPLRGHSGDWKELVIGYVVQREGVDRDSTDGLYAVDFDTPILVRKDQSDAEHS